MKRHWTTLVFGLLVALLPFLGFPHSFDTVVFVVAGTFLFIIALSFIRDANHRPFVGKVQVTPPDVDESLPQQEDEVQEIYDGETTNTETFSGVSEKLEL